MAAIGLFPLGIVLLPEELVPLHIFEPRYRELIAECLDAEIPFGLLLHDESGPRRIGTYAAVVDVLERFDDGRLNILVKGEARFRIVAMTEGRAFATAEVEEVADEPGEPDATAVQRCVEAYEKLAEASGVEPVPATGEAAVSYRIAVHVGLEPETKQELLEELSEPARIARLTEILAGMLHVMELKKTARKRASGNGLVDHL